MSDFKWLEERSPFNYIMELIDHWLKEYPSEKDVINLKKMKDNINQHPQIASTFMPYVKNKATADVFIKTYLNGMK